MANSPRRTVEPHVPPRRRSRRATPEAIWRHTSRFDPAFTEATPRGVQCREDELVRLEARVRHLVDEGFRAADWLEFDDECRVEGEGHAAWLLLADFATLARFAADRLPDLAERALNRLEQLALQAEEFVRSRAGAELPQDELAVAEAKLQRVLLSCRTYARGVSDPAPRPPRVVRLEVAIELQDQLDDLLQIPWPWPLPAPPTVVLTTPDGRRRELSQYEAKRMWSYSQAVEGLQRPDGEAAALSAADYHLFADIRMLISKNPRQFQEPAIWLAREYGEEALLHRWRQEWEDLARTKGRTYLPDGMSHRELADRRLSAAKADGLGFHCLRTAVEDAATGWLRKFPAAPAPERLMLARRLLFLTWLLTDRDAARVSETDLARVPYVPRLGLGRCLAFYHMLPHADCWMARTREAYQLVAGIETTEPMHGEESTSGGGRHLQRDPWRDESFPVYRRLLLYAAHCRQQGHVRRPPVSTVCEAIGCKRSSLYNGHARRIWNQWGSISFNPGALLDTQRTRNGSSSDRLRREKHCQEAGAERD